MTQRSFKDIQIDCKKGLSVMLLRVKNKKFEALLRVAEWFGLGYAALDNKTTGNVICRGHQ